MKDQMALNDLLLELDHFVDNRTIQKIEMEMLQDILRYEWKLADDFNLVEHRNQEIDLVMSEMEEKSWRSAAMIDQRDSEYVE